MQKKLLSILSSILVCVLVIGSVPETALALTGDPVMVGAGDIARCGALKDEATAKLLDAIPGTVYTLGDNAYWSGTLSEFTDCYEPSWGRHKSRTRPAIGNHEYETSGASGYFTYFGAAASPNETGCTSDCTGYYSYDLGTWHIIVLNSELPHYAGSPQEQWLRADLAAHTNTCTLAYWHRPRFSSGRYGNNSDIVPLWKALYAYRADVVVNGDEHMYERFGKQTPGGVASARGIRQFIVGTGGGRLYAFGTVKPNSQVRNNTTWGVLKLVLHAGSYNWRFVPIAGQTFTDSGRSYCVR